ncbi:hypothetical protein BDW66DRAFT_136279 [Aspergillus desertorum]
MVRAHVRKWISTQTKDRAAGSAVVPVDPPPVTSAGPDAAFKERLGRALPSFSRWLVKFVASIIEVLARTVQLMPFTASTDLYQAVSFAGRVSGCCSPEAWPLERTFATTATARGLPVWFT